MNFDQNKCSIQAILVTMTLLVLFLSAFQVIAPIVLLILGIYILIQIENSDLLNSQTALFFVIFFVALISFLLIFSYFMQYNFPFKINVHVFRQILDILFTGFGIAVLVLAGSGREQSVLENIEKNWEEHPQNIINFEEKHNCNNLEVHNTTKSVFCDSFLTTEFAKIYSRSRDMRIPFALFWTSMIIYDVLSIIVLIIDYHEA